MGEVRWVRDTTQHKRQQQTQNGINQICRRLMASARTYLNTQTCSGARG